MKKITIKIEKENLLKRRENKDHLSAQIKYPHLVTEDKRRKRPKHRNKLEENSY